MKPSWILLCLTLAVLLGQGCKREKAPPKPGEVVSLATDAFLASRPADLYALLPTSYRAAMKAQWTKVVEAIEPEVWDNFGKALDTMMRGLEKHKAKVADGTLPLPQGARREDMTRALQELQTFWKVLKAEQLHTHQGAAALDLEAFLAKQGPQVMKGLRELARLGHLKADLKALDEVARTLRVEPLEQSETRVVLRVFHGKPVKVKVDAPAAEAPAPQAAEAPPATPGQQDVLEDLAPQAPAEELYEERQPSLELAFVRVDGYWVPEPLAQAWGPALEKFSGDLDGALSEYEAQRQDWLDISRKALDAAARFEETGDFMALLGVLPR